MIYIECEQGTEEWHAARCGVITASRFKDACDKLKSGAPSSKLQCYAAEVALERVTAQAADQGYVTWQMKRGTELEPLARMAYEANTGHMATEAGVVLTDDRLFGYSTDGFIERDGLIEIKCPASPEKIIDMWREGDLSEYIHQIQGGLWITGRLWADFIMYCPALACVGKDLFVKRVERNEAFIEKLEADLMAFAAMVKDNEDVLRQEAA
jgi:exodeoxyribonuclease (lambda-induced)